MTVEGKERIFLLLSTNITLHLYGSHLLRADGFFICFSFQSLNDLMAALDDI